MTDHHDFGHHDDHLDPPPFDDQPLAPYDDSAHDDDYAAHEEIAAHDDAAWEQPPAVPETEVDLPEWQPDLADGAAQAAAEHIEVFPPALDVDLPEPVDGFPWIDTGSLGVVTPDLLAAAAGEPEPVTAQEIADYAAADLPPGADPWAALTDSDDPATAALARWWSPS